MGCVGSYGYPSRNVNGSFHWVFRENDLEKLLVMRKHSDEEKLLEDIQEYQRFMGNLRQAMLKEGHAEKSEEQNRGKIAYS